jgi:hypothetical protein
MMKFNFSLHINLGLNNGNTEVPLTETNILCQLQVHNFSLCENTIVQNTHLGKIKNGRIKAKPNLNRTRTNNILEFASITKKFLYVSTHLFHFINDCVH